MVLSESPRRSQCRIWAVPERPVQSRQAQGGTCLISQGGASDADDREGEEEGRGRATRGGEGQPVARKGTWLASSVYGVFEVFLFSFSYLCGLIKIPGIT